MERKFYPGKEVVPLNPLLRHLRGYRWESVLAPLFKMLEASFDLLVPLVMADIVNTGIARPATCAISWCGAVCCWRWPLLV